MRLAALDLGSNTFLCLIADVTLDGQILILKDLSEVVRLGQGVSESGLFSDEALNRADLCLKGFSSILTQFKPDQVFGVTTAAARSVSNSQELINRCEKYKIPIQIISGDKEAELTFSGALSGIESHFKKKKSFLVIDIGGGSTEIIIGNSEKLSFKKSFNIGVVKLRENFITRFPITSEVQSQIKEEIIRVFIELKKIKKEKELEVIAVAGTPTSLAAAVIGKYDPKIIDGFIFTIQQLREWVDLLTQLTPETIEVKFSIQKGRSDVLAVGVMILIGILEVYQCEQLQVSTRGIRFGLLLENSKGVSRL